MAAHDTVERGGLVVDARLAEERPDENVVIVDVVDVGRVVDIVDDGRVADIVAGEILLVVGCRMPDDVRVVIVDSWSSDGTLVAIGVWEFCESHDLVSLVSNV